MSVATSKNAGLNFRFPSGGFDDASGKQLEQAVNAPKGLHGDSITRSLVVAASGPASRLLLLGEQSIPNGVSLRIAGVCRIL